MPQIKGLENDLPTLCKDVFFLKITSNQYKILNCQGTKPIGALLISTFAHSIIIFYINIRLF